MELTIYKRSDVKKGVTKRLRLLKNIPAIVYGEGKDNESIYLKKSDMEAVLRHIKKGNLSTTVFTLKDESNTFKAIVKEIQYHVTTYEIIHIDFIRLNDDKLVNVKVPIICTGAANCSGIKLGGVLRQVVRSLKVRCYPKNLPEEFYIDVSKLVLNDSVRLKQIQMPKGVTPLAQMEEVAVVIAKR
jgi:large subunit ribosomal protein L25